MNIDELVKQYTEASHRAFPGESITREEIRQYKAKCKAVERFLTDDAMHKPIGWIDVGDAGSLIQSPQKAHRPELDPYEKDNKDAANFPALPVYLISPVDVLASTLAKLALDAEEHGPISAEEIRALYDFFTVPLSGTPS